MIQSLELPEKLAPLFKPKRYKILYGGRGGAKSWGIARALLALGAEKKLRILCARELQNSIKDSVHKLLSDQITALNLQSFYEIQTTSIKGKNGTEFGFEGLKSNIVQLKSYEGADICWVEEAQTVSKYSWDILIPTIRKDGSEIWVSFNPELDTDDTYQRFIVNPPKESIIIEMSYKDNPWFTNVLEMERQDLKERDMAAYLNVWEGECRTVIDGAVYGNEIKAAIEHNRITKVDYDPRVLVHTFQDLGWNDKQSIWFVQKVDQNYHFIDYYESRFASTRDDVKALQSKPYIYGTDFIPHDGSSTDKTSGLSAISLMRQLGRKVEGVPKLGIRDGIDAVRTIFPLCYFDRDKCQEGLNALKRYKYDVNNLGEMSKEPKHDDASHAADALRYFAVRSGRVTDAQREWKRPVPLKRGYGRI